LSHDLCAGRCERGEAVQDGNTNLELRDLTVEVPRHEALTQWFHTVHPGFDAASAVTAAPSSPDGTAEAFRGAQGLGARDRAGSVGLAWLGLLARRNDRGCTAGGYRLMALAGVEGAISGDAGDILIGWDLVQKLGQHGCVADIAGGDLGSPDFQRFLVNSYVDLAPDAAFGAAVLAGVPLPFALNLDACAVDQQV